MRTIDRELFLPVGVADAFALLHTPSAIREWWSAARVVLAARAGGAWVGAWGSDEDAPDYITVARVVVWEPPHRFHLGQFEYYTKNGEGLPFAADLETQFSVRPQLSGSVLGVRQIGFPDESIGDAFLAACEDGWTATFDGIRRYVIDRAGSGVVGR